MSTRAIIGGYRIVSSDAFLSNDDTVVSSSTGEKRSLDDVYDYIQGIGPELAQTWLKALKGGSKLSLRTFEKGYLQKLFQTSGTFSCHEREEVQCPKNGPRLPMETCFYESEWFHIIARRAYGIVCAGSNQSDLADFLKKYGGKILHNGWGGSASNCFTYALRSVTGWGKEIALDDIYLGKVRGHSRIFPALETVLQLFFRPVAVIPSKELPIQEWSKIQPQDQVVLQIIDQANRRLDQLLQAGKLDEQKAVGGEYVMIFSLPLNYVRQGDSPRLTLHSPHAGILRLDRANKRWSLESKLSIGADVYSADVGAKMFLYQMGALQKGFHGDLFYRIYEAGLAEPQDTRILDMALSAEPILDEGEVVPKPN